MTKALESYQKAVEIDPSYALAHAGIAWVSEMMGVRCYLSPERAHTQAKIATEHALRLDENLADVQTALWAIRFFYEWNYDGAEESIKRAIELEPNQFEFHSWYGIQLAFMDRLEEAVSETKLAQGLDPLSTYAHYVASVVFLLRNQHERAIQEIQKALDIDPNYAVALCTLGGAYIRSSRYDDAIALLEKVATITKRTPFYLAWLGWAYGASGRLDQAREIVEELRSRAEHEYVSPVCFSWILGELKEDEAFDWLEKAFEERVPHLFYRRLPLYDSLRPDPRFKDLLRRMNLSP
jgi:serine/threonine-protein kinase